MHRVPPALRRFVAAGVALAAVAAMGACSAAPEAGGKKVVVTTVAPLTDIVYNIACDRVVLVQTIPDGADSHTFTLPPSVAKDLARADLIILNGLHLEEPARRLAETNKKGATPVLLLADNTITPDQWVFDFSFPASGGDPNPHLWTNPLLAKRYAELVRDTLAKVDATNAQIYRQSYDRYAQDLDALDRAARAAVASIPEGNRRLLTYHDSWAYFAPEYGMKVIGAIQPSDFSNPSAREVADLITQVQRERVPAIFGSEVYPSNVMAQLARETGAKYVTDLRDDDPPGDPGGPQHSYLGMMVSNLRSMADALGGDPKALDGVPTVSHCGKNR